MQSIVFQFKGNKKGTDDKNKEMSPTSVLVPQTFPPEKETQKRIYALELYQWKEGHISKEKLFIRNHGHKK